MKTFRRLLYLLGSGRHERELAEEIELHRLSRRDALIRDGLSMQDADVASRRAMGNVTLAREDAQDTWRWSWQSTVRQDVTYALRMLRGSPAFTIVAILSLALAIAATTSIFSVVDGVLLRPLPYAAPEQLVVIGRPATVAPGTFLDWRERARSFAAMGAAEYWTPNLAGPGRAEQINALRITPDLFDTLGIPASLGRLFDTPAGHDMEAVISDRFWRARFGGTPGVLGMTLVLDGRPYSIVGVMPPSFRFAPFWATKAEVWTPLVLEGRRNDREGSSLRVFARLRPGVTLAAARAEMDSLAVTLDAQFPNTNSGVQVVYLHERVVGNVRRALTSLLAAVFLVLLIACSNVAHLQLVRGAERSREMSLRTALGASRARLARQMFTESVVIAAFGGVLGCWGTVTAVSWLVWLAPATLPRLEAVHVDVRVLAFGVLATAAAAILFGVAPAWRTAKADPGTVLKRGRRGSTSGGIGGARRMLIASEIAMALVLLIAGGLLFKSFRSLVDVDPGIAPHGLLAAEVSVKGTSEETPGRRAAFFTTLIDRLRRSPDVVSASAINHLPLAGDQWRLGVAIQGRPTSPPGEEPHAIFRVVMPGYFHTMGIPLVRGRDIGAQDVGSALHVVVVNETMARRYWPGQDPIGQRITNDDRQPATTDWFTIVGVVRDAVQSEWGAPIEEETFFPFAQTKLYTMSPASFAASMTVVVRVAGDAAAAAPLLSGHVSALNPAVALARIGTMDAVIAEAFTSARFYLTILSLFGAAAIVLAVIGLYGVMADTATGRRHEIGVRIALGARRDTVVRRFMREALELAGAGIAAGLAVASVAMHSLQPLLYRVQAFDSVVFGSVTMLVVVVSAAAAAWPAWRAARMNPMDSLREG